MKKILILAQPHTGMEHCFWIILAVMTGLTSTEARNFQLVVQKGNTITEYHVTVQNDSTASMRYQAGQPGDSISVEMKTARDKSWMKTSFLHDTIDMHQYFRINKIKWDKLSALRFQKEYEKEGETELTIIRSPGKIYLKQSSGSFTYFPVIYSTWNTAAK